MLCTSCFAVDATAVPEEKLSYPRDFLRFVSQARAGGVLSPRIGTKNFLKSKKDPGEGLAKRNNPAPQ
jgi:hypothetical protein